MIESTFVTKKGMIVLLASLAMCVQKLAPLTCLLAEIYTPFPSPLGGNSPTCTYILQYWENQRKNAHFFILNIERQSIGKYFETQKTEIKGVLGVTLGQRKKGQKVKGSRSFKVTQKLSGIQSPFHCQCNHVSVSDICSIQMSFFGFQTYLCRVTFVKCPRL